MSGETHDPVLGPPRSSDPFIPGAVPSADPPANPAEQGRGTPLAPYSSSSGDELNALLAESIVQPHPDPLLGSFSSGEQPAAPAVPEMEGSSPPLEAAPGEPLPAESSPVSSAEDEVPSDSDQPEETAAPSVGSFDALSALASLAGQESAGSAAPPSDDIVFPASLVTESPKAATPVRDEARKDEDADDDDDDDDEEEAHPRERSWLTLLLISYSSAVTLGLLWVLLGGRRLQEADDLEPFPVTENRADPGRRANQSRRFEPPQPLAADHLTTLGQTVRLGALEVTPEEVRAGRVELERVFGEGEQRDGGDDALRLKLRLKNVSSDTIFVPLDEAFLREPIGGAPDSFIETADGATIAMYPLAVESEWSIRGQSFEELQPGASCDAEIISETKVSDRLTPAMTWRVRLRTGIEKTDTLGIRFRKDEIR